ncbi:MAG: FAD:protein FMN transferase ApbE, partial [SAR324 cluster bacterium]
MTSADNFPRRRSRSHKIVLYGLLLFILSLAGCDQPAPQIKPVALTGRTMGTTYSIKLVPPTDSLQVQELHDEINGSLKEINQLMSTYIPDSELMKFNAHQGADWYPVSEKTQQVVSMALDIAVATEGALDITVGALVELWGFGRKKGDDMVPSAEEITALIGTVNYHQVQTREDPPALKKVNAQVTLDLSSIAKGFAVDQIAEILEKSGIQNYLVEVGGEMRGNGVKQENKPWVIAIERPTSIDRSIQQLISLENHGLATSGDYRNYFEKDGKRYSHTINPQTGRPITHNLASVSVIAKTSMEADAWATAFTVLGPEKGFQLAQQKKMA